METSDTAYKLPRSSDMVTTVGCLMIAYFIGRKVGRHQTLKMVKAIGKNDHCSCSQ